MRLLAVLLLGLTAPACANAGTYVYVSVAGANSPRVRPALLLLDQLVQGLSLWQASPWSPRVLLAVLDQVARRRGTRPGCRAAACAAGAASPGSTAGSRRLALAVALGSTRARP